MNKSSSSSTPSSSYQQDGKKDAIVDQAKTAMSHVASDVAGQAREQVNAQFDTRKDKAVETMGNVASAIRETSDKLKGVGPLGDVAGRAADGIESVAEFFEGKQITDVVRDVEKFAKREPALFLGAALAIGLIGGRFLKSSAPRQEYVAQGAGGYDVDDEWLSDDDFEEAIESRRNTGYAGSGYGGSGGGYGNGTGGFA
jgi:hypothetical protein